MAFEIASTNLVIELGIILALLLSWQFTLAEFVGGPIMIVLMAWRSGSSSAARLIEAARRQADKGVAGSMEGHAAMDMSIAAAAALAPAGQPGRVHLGQPHLRHGVGRGDPGHRPGLLIAGAVAAWVPDSFWQHLFLTGHPLAARLWGPIIGPVISMLSFVCSIGNVPLAAVLWNGGISFGGVVGVHLRRPDHHPDPGHLPEVLRHRDDARVLGIFYATMVAGGYIVEFLFGGLGLIPAERAAKVADTGIQWNYTTVLNIIFLLLAAALLVRFFRSGGGPMLKMMGGSPDSQDHTRAPWPRRTRGMGHAPPLTSHAPPRLDAGGGTAC